MSFPSVEAIVEDLSKVSKDDVVFTNSPATQIEKDQKRNTDQPVTVSTTEIDFKKCIDYFHAHKDLQKCLDENKLSDILTNIEQTSQHLDTHLRKH